jgi:hypothetical protein
MRRVILSAMVAASFALASAREPNRSALLEAIRLRENSHTRGAAGELGPYQMVPKTVRDAGGYDRAAATRHLMWIERQLARKRVAVSAFNIALCWNAGLERATSGRAKESSYWYATDVERIYHSLRPQP